jgi:undecaprenyl-diphosphatase
VLGGTIMSLFNVIKDGSDFSLLPVYLAGFVIAAVVGYFAIQLIRRLIANSGIGKFSYYCWGIGAITLVLSFVLK